jgi:hypothetical protein
MACYLFLFFFYLAFYRSVASIIDRSQCARLPARKLDSEGQAGGEIQTFAGLRGGSLTHLPYHAQGGTRSDDLVSPCLADSLSNLHESQQEMPVNRFRPQRKINWTVENLGSILISSSRYIIGDGTSASAKSRTFLAEMTLLIFDGGCCIHQNSRQNIWTPKRRPQLEIIDQYADELNGSPAGRVREKRPHCDHHKGVSIVSCSGT